MSSSNGAIMGVKRGLSLCQNSSPTIENESGTARICTPDDNIHRRTIQYDFFFWTIQLGNTKLYQVY